MSFLGQRQIYFLEKDWVISNETHYFLLHRSFYSIYLPFWYSDPHCILEKTVCSQVPAFECCKNARFCHAYNYVNASARQILFCIFQIFFLLFSQKRRKTAEIFLFFLNVGPPQQESSFHGHLANAFIFMINIYMITIFCRWYQSKLKKIDSNLLLFLDRNSTRSTPQKKNELSYISCRRGSNLRPSSSK